MDEYVSVIAAIDIMGGNIDVNPYRVEKHEGTKHGFIISSGREEDGNYRMIFESEPDFDNSEEARQKGVTLLDEVRKERWGEI